ncbi:MAG: aldehyde dehydrogenase family protein [Christensenellales bacterium]
MQDVISPGSGEVLGRIPLGTPEDADAALQAAKKAAPALAAMTVFERAEICWDCGQDRRKPRGAGKAADRRARQAVPQRSAGRGSGLCAGVPRCGRADQMDGRQGSGAAR